MDRSTSPPLISAERLAKNFGSVRAVRDVSFSIQRGQAVGFLGPNGAGKTTTFRMLAGSLGPSSGHVSILGTSLTDEPLRAKKSLGYMPEVPPLYPEMTAREYLLYRAALRGLPRRERSREVSRVAELTQLTHYLPLPIAHLSKGYRQRVALANALLGDPPVLLLDEPTAGLDPNQIHEVRALLRELRKDHTILLSTHILSEVEANCDHALILHQGTLVFDGSLDELRSQTHGTSAQLLLSGDAERTRLQLQAAGFHVEQLTEPSAPPGAFALLLSSSSASSTHQLISEALPLCMHAGCTVYQASPTRAALDEVFRSLTIETTASAPSVEVSSS